MLERLIGRADRLQAVRTGPASGLWIGARGIDPEMVRGTYEVNVQRALVGELVAGDVFYDVGANIGFFSLLAARCVGPSGRVYAFEPLPGNCSAIRRSLVGNHIENVELCEAAAATSGGEAVLNVAQHIGGATLDGWGVPPDLRERMRVRTVAIDELVFECGWRSPDFVKIDVEGAEIAVLRGMEMTLERHRPGLLIELDDASPGGLAEKKAAVLALLGRYGYALHPLADSYPNVEWQVCHLLFRADRSGPKASADSSSNAPRGAQRA
ncbi:MAG: FkbM family methyltransferase [Hyphomicrobiaceae bacterium]